MNEVVLECIEVIMMTIIIMITGIRIALTECLTEPLKRNNKQTLKKQTHALLIDGPFFTANKTREALCDLAQHGLHTG